MHQIKQIFYIFLFMLMLAAPTVTFAFSDSSTSQKQQSIIIEVDGKPQERKEYIETYYPSIDVIATYEKLFQGLALKGDVRKLEKLATLEFVKTMHAVRTYEVDKIEIGKSEADQLRSSFQAKRMLQSALGENNYLPHEMNQTPYTGNGVKVGVIDTGIDYTHPDLKTNYAGGYDLVDLDKDPMETKPAEGIATLHGTHVAGIIAANGTMQGVAPNARIYAYRALGPGGVGTSVQVIAALEQAVKDKMDVINLSLGNTINGPDYPTSQAVNRATELGASVVIANGNNGPSRWTVGAPATATKAISVGAYASPIEKPMLSIEKEDKTIAIQSMHGAIPWNLMKDYEIVQATKAEDLAGKIALFSRGKIPFSQLAKQAEEQGAVAALIYNNEEGSFQGTVADSADTLSIPVASISKQSGFWLKNYSEQLYPFVATRYEIENATVAPFSSRGPVTMNWKVKPDLIAPGTNIVSTVPGGYQSLQGTSMAAPHIAGVIALLKEARPSWSNEKITAALKTTANQLVKESGQSIEPIAQGTGLVNPMKAINAKTIIYNQSISFGKIDAFRKTNVTNITIENTSNTPQTFTFHIPIKKKGISWHLPQRFTIPKHAKKKVPIELSVTSNLLKEGLHQGWLTLNQQDQTYHLPYVFLNKTADYPRAMGFSFELEPFSEDEFTYQLYLAEAAKEVRIELYDPDTLIYERTLLQLKDASAGLNDGKMDKADLGKPGLYKVMLTVHLENGTFENHELDFQILP
ncbi:S8 family serine peptidase [Virgibacillus sp. MG-45]|uniref:S8 family serine peptidase n=1 Tax=Virgibacillus sp. MG-45 TaxID=3102791 RepID=UPI002EDB04E8